MEATSKGALLERLAAEEAAFEAFLAAVGEARMERPGATGGDDDWALKDVIAHLTAWRWRSVEELEAAARGEVPAPPPWPADLPTEGPDEWSAVNAWLRERDRGKSLAEVLADSRASFRRLEAAVRALPEEDLLTPGRFPWADGEALGPAVLASSFGHFHDEHESTLRAWLAGIDGNG